MDECELLEASVRADGVAIEGARGQRVAHPALAALAKQRALFSKLATELFPDLNSETPSQKAARAARTRWERQRDGR